MCNARNIRPALLAFGQPAEPARATVSVFSVQAKTFAQTFARGSQPELILDDLR